MGKIGKNDPCLCGSGEKYKKCCLGKKPRQHTVMVGSPVPLKGFDYDRETMRLVGIAHDDYLVKPVVTFSQTHYIGQSGKEKVLTRIQDRVIPNEADLMKHLTSFDMIMAVDTNTMEIGGDTLSVSGIVQCQVNFTENLNTYLAEFPWHGVRLFRNCPQELSPEKFGWLSIITELSRNSQNTMKKFCFVSDYDLDNHGLYNNRKLPIFRDIYLPSNITIMYGKSDSSKENLLNYLIQFCDREATQVLKEMDERGCYKFGDKNISIGQIPVPTV